MSVVPSPPSSCPSSSAAPFSNNMRYEVILEAPTAAAQKSEDLPLTYLNKGQMYGLSITDAEEFEGDISTTVSIMFHDESHRKVAVDFWKFWLSQQKDPDNARAIDIDTTHSNGVYNIECPYFDGISFRWNGKAGVSINIRFNFLSTDFSRIKGVKGIPLRLHVASQAVAAESTPLERCYCQIKLFRDKGAERKNKDDARHIEKQLEKLRGKNGEPHPMWLGYLQTQPYTVLCAFASSSPPPLTHPHHLLQQQQQQYHDHYRRFNEHTTVSSLPMTPTTTTQGVGVKRPYDMTPGGGVTIPPPPSSAAAQHQQPYFMPPTVTDMDPSYVPQQRRRTAKLCLFAKLPNEHLHRAIYLEELTVEDLKDKLASKMGHENSSQIKEVVRRVAGKEDVVVQIDDTVVSDMPEEQVLEVETKSNDNDDSLTLMLLY
ncbi:hypothetical protein O0I10_004128 [Lichtheimia ornata]|uniref:Grh/CP2 DB domain-containing protein n=1 Tax=Lichtheimia ornata TaxID=688661 RepID=A0AAD7V9X3_9FUNG|nr:uncharacterized protein O0I10_004128 [Lichtheimia ornata]KAJ8660266.1 hypothetical protein O0I10_004128 [Lichtheimia ornata]